MKKVLFVCLGNICRSPAAEGILRHKLQDRGLLPYVEVDSAGLISEHAGERPDPRMLRAAATRGYQLPGRARPVVSQDFETFDYILAMDRQNLAGLRSLPKTDLNEEKVFLFTHWLDQGGADIPDPYYGGSSGFELVLDLVESSADAFLDFLEGEIR